MAHKAPLSMGFSRQEHWRGSPCLPPGDLPDPGIEPVSLVAPALAGDFFITVPPGNPKYYKNKLQRIPEKKNVTKAISISDY